MVSKAQLNSTKKYQEAHYINLSARIDKILVQEFKTVLAANGDSLAGWLKARMIEYIEQHKNV